jgi:CspA family cold shock protein
VFVHISAVERCGLPGLREGQTISFETEVGKNGKSAATNLKLV